MAVQISDGGSDGAANGVETNAILKLASERRYFSGR